MGLIDKAKSIIKETLPDVVTNGDISGQSGEMLWKFNNNALITGSRLIVGESQEAIFVEGGRIAEIYGPGTYDLETENKPILTHFIEKAYGGGSPNAAEIWFVNKSAIMEIPWGTPSPIAIEDRRYTLPMILNVRINGSIAVKVTDSRLLFTELGGQGGKFSVDRFRDNIKSILVSRLRKAVGTLMTDKQYGYIDMQNNINELEEPIRASVESELVRFGIIVEGSYVRGFSVVEDDSFTRFKQYEDQLMQGQLAQKTKEYEMQSRLDSDDADMRRMRMESSVEAERLDLMDSDYESSRKLDIMEKAAENKSPQGGVGRGVGIGTGIGMGRAIHSRFQEDTGLSLGLEKQPKKETTKCPGCGEKVDKGVKFCPECGFVVARVCGGCKKVDANNSKFCPDCGKKFNFCPHCGTDNDAEATNCGKCEKILSTEVVCPECGEKIKTGKKFCPECGTKIQED